jgi:hypothetical protein
VHHRHFGAVDEFASKQGAPVLFHRRICAPGSFAQSVPDRSGFFGQIGKNMWVIG